jgi:hypothetical protein
MTEYNKMELWFTCLLVSTALLVPTWAAIICEWPKLIRVVCATSASVFWLVGVFSVIWMVMGANHD